MWKCSILPCGVTSLRPPERACREHTHKHRYEGERYNDKLKRYNDKVEIKLPEGRQVRQLHDDRKQRYGYLRGFVSTST